MFGGGIRLLASRTSISLRACVPACLPAFLVIDIVALSPHPLGSRSAVFVLLTGEHTTHTRRGLLCSD